MTHEEFVHICLKIRKGDVMLDIPCCANCKYYKEMTPNGYRCVHPRLLTNGKQGYLVMQPEDFCSRWEKSEEVL